MVALPKVFESRLQNSVDQVLSLQFYWWHPGSFLYQCMQLCHGSAGLRREFLGWEPQNCMSACGDFVVLWVL